MPLRSFPVRYRFAGADKTAFLPEWLADSVDDRFGGELGLTQTTRVAVHQTKLRLLAASVDAAMDERGIDHLSIDDIDAAMVESGLLAAIERHRAAWGRIVEPGKPVPSFGHAFELQAADPAEPAFLQCPGPPEEPGEVGEGLRLLPDHGFSVPAQVSPADDTELAFQLIGFAGRLWYYKGKPVASRPLGQAVAVDVPGRPAWRVRHELRVLLEGIGQGRNQFGFRGDVVFAWLLPFLPRGRPIPRGQQHPLLLDVPSPVRVQADGRVVVHSWECPVGDRKRALPTAALALREHWAATGLPCIALKRVPKPKAGGSKGDAGALEAVGLDPIPEFIQKPYGKVPDSRDILALLQGAPVNGDQEGLRTPVLKGYAEGLEPIGDQAGAELVIEGEPIGTSTTAFWLDVRIPLPEPNAGAETGEARWRGWQGTVERQIKVRAERADRLKAAAKAAWAGRRGTSEKELSEVTKRKAGAFAKRWVRVLEAETDPALWRIAAQTWNDRATNEARWSAELDRAVRDAATQAFEALGGFDDAATLLASAGLLALADAGGRRAA